jgi:predicted S18 family serine protease
MERKIYIIFSFSLLSFTLLWFAIIIQQQTILIEKQSEQLQLKEKLISQLEQQLANLSLQIDQQKDFIEILQQRLGLAQSEIESLKPVIKNYWALGVKGTGEGIVIPIEIKITKGTGLVSVNIKNIDMLLGTQNSVRTAVAAATTYTGMQTMDKDIMVTFTNTEPDIVVIDGPSAGAAITIAIIAALQNASFAENVLITGTIESNGAIGQVGSVANKIEAAKKWGANRILVPKGQSIAISGITVIEVQNIWDAVPYILKF